MALIRLSPIIGSISGSLGPLTFKNTRFGPLATSRLLRTKTRSPAQQSSDSRWVTLTRTWNALTTSQRIAWAQLAKQIPFTNSLGTTYLRSGFSLFTQHSNPAFHAGLSLPTDPPHFPPLPAPIQLTADFDVVTGYLITWTILGPTTPVRLLTYGSRPVAIPTIDYRSPGYFPPPYIFRNWRFLSATSEVLGFGGLDIEKPFSDALGFCQAGEAVAVRTFLWHPDALASPTTYISTFVTP